MSDSAPARVGTGRLRSGAWMAMAVSAIATAILWRFDVVGMIAPSPATSPPPAASIVRLNSRPELEVPAAAPREWSIADPRFGTVKVVVPVGMTPRQALANALAERGFQVVP